MAQALPEGGSEHLRGFVIVLRYALQEPATTITRTSDVERQTSATRTQRKSVAWLS